jgi:hypothetical protein
MNNKDIIDSLDLLSLSRKVLSDNKTTYDFNKEFDEQEVRKEFLNTVNEENK